MGADTYTATLGVILMGTGNDNNSWGANCNSLVFQIFEDAIANVLTSAVTGGTLDLSGTPPPAAASQARYAALAFTGVLGSNQTVQVPNLTKFWFVNNGTSGAFTLKFKTPSGSASTAIPQNSGWQIVFCDGSNNIVVFPFNTAQIQMPDGSAAAPAYSDVNETNSGWYRAGTQDWRLSINGIDALQVTGAGASSPSIVNAPLGIMQQAGVNIIPPGVEFPYAGISAPAGFFFEFGQTVSRSTYANLLAAVRQQFTGTFVNGNTHITGINLDLRGIGLKGATLESATPGVTNLTISSIDSATQITMSTTASASSGGAVTIFAYPFGNGNGTTTFTIPDRRGRTLFGRDDMGGTAAGRLSFSVDGTKLGTAGGQDNTFLSQSNLPGVSFSVTIGAGQGSHSHALTNAAAVASSAATGGQVNPAGSNMGFTSIAANTLPGLSGSASSGGSTSSFDITNPCGITNYIIKF